MVNQYVSIKSNALHYASKRHATIVTNLGHIENGTNINILTYVKYIKSYFIEVIKSL